VPGLGFVPFLFSNSDVISAPVTGDLLIIHSSRNDKNPFISQPFIFKEKLMSYK
jgi:hypothetical protein